MPTESFIDDRGVLWFVHSRYQCRVPCTFHRPSKHHMNLWPIVVRETTLVERICKHGVGHPDPDSLRYLERKHPRGMWGVHGCCGCCRKKPLPTPGGGER